jgi:hypothetical protein
MSVMTMRNENNVGIMHGIFLLQFVTENTLFVASNNLFCCNSLVLALRKKMQE